MAPGGLLRPTLLLVAVLGAVLLVSTPPAAARVDLTRSSLEVKDLKVEFLPNNRIRVQGRLRCRGLEQKDEAEQAWSEVRVDVDLPNADQQFGILPEEWRGEDTTGEDRGNRMIYWTWRGKKYSQKRKKPFFYSTALKVGPTVFEKNHDDGKDEGRWLVRTELLQPLSKED